MKAVRKLAAALAVLFLLPAFATAGWWASVDRPSSWRAADWSSSGLLPLPDASGDAAIYVLSARTGGFKGAFSTHCWIVLKKPGRSTYERYDKVGWGSPIRRDVHVADGRWYSNVPEMVGQVTGARAARLISRVEAAIATYPYGNRGDYRIYPGPNSNTFVAHILRKVPELGFALPPTAVGRDYPTDGSPVRLSLAGSGVHATALGLVGFAFGAERGIEVHLMGLVAGASLSPAGLKVPAYGFVGFG